MASDDRYRLAPLRDSRNRDERVRRGELANVSADARESEQALAAARTRTEAGREQLARALAAQGSLGSLAQRVLAERHVAHLRRKLSDLVAEELRAQASHEARLGAVDSARLVLARARADREVIERHFRRWREEQAKIAERRED